MSDALIRQHLVEAVEEGLLHNANVLGEEAWVEAIVFRAESVLNDALARDRARAERLADALRKITGEYDHTYLCTERPQFPCRCIFGQAREALAEWDASK